MICCVRFGTPASPRRTCSSPMRMCSRICSGSRSSPSESPVWKVRHTIFLCNIMTMLSQNIIQAHNLPVINRPILQNDPAQIVLSQLSTYRVKYKINTHYEMAHDVNFFLKSQSQKEKLFNLKKTTSTFLSNILQSTMQQRPAICLGEFHLMSLDHPIC